MESVLSRYDINIPQDRVKAVAELENEISWIYSAAERDVYIQIAAKKLNVTPESIKDDVKRIMDKNVRNFKKNEGEKAIQMAAGYSDKVNPDYAKAPAIAKHEEVVLGLLLVYPDHRKLAFEEKLLNEEDFFTAFNKRVFNYVKAMYEDPDESSDINEIFTPEEVGRITKIKIARMELEVHSTELLRESINALKSSMQKKSAADTATYDELASLIAKLRAEN
jgi:replicative DNA helicase